MERKSYQKIQKNYMKNYMNKNGDHINDKTDIEFEAELIIRKLSDIVDIIQ